MAARLLMVAGTMSGVGKSTLVAALCRLLAQAGVAVAPFKAQNMSLNAAVTPDGAEISRAQAAQAEAAGVAPVAAMNPILLKPEGPERCQVVVMGRVWRTLAPREYYRLRDSLRGVVLQALQELAERFEVVLIEGAGGAAELNLREGDFVNLGLAQEVGAPAVLVGDIERGGIFAQLLGTLELLESGERQRVQGLVVNKFRGDPALFAEGVRILEVRSGLGVWGVLPYLEGLSLAAEDSLDLGRLEPGARATARGRLGGAELDEGGSHPGSGPRLDIAVVAFPHIANFDEFEALAAEPDVRLRLVREPAAVGFPDLLVLPGSKNTLADLTWLRRVGLDRVVRHLARWGVPVLGICGGYQMLGLVVEDPLGVESAAPAAEQGLGLLPVRTQLAREKITRQVSGRVVEVHGFWSAWRGMTFEAYEIHAGRTVAVAGVVAHSDTEALGHCATHPLPHWAVDPMHPVDSAGSWGSPAGPWMRLVRQPHGETVENGCLAGHVAGTYCHGLLANAGLRSALIEALWRRRGLDARPLKPETPAGPGSSPYDRLARWAREHLDLARLGACLGIQL